MKSDKPVKCPVWQKDGGNFLINKKRCPRPEKIPKKMIIFPNGLIYGGFDPAI
jgi:hypothetical protein